MIGVNGGEFRVRILIIAVLGALLSGCLSLGGGGAPRSEPGVWVRADGQSGRENPSLATIFNSDKAACTPAGSVEPDRTCMAQRGYVLVPESQAASKAAEFRAATTARNNAPVQ
jgi:hypothetical protein